MLAGLPGANRPEAVVFYSVFFMNWKGDEEPFAPVSVETTLRSFHFAPLTGDKIRRYLRETMAAFDSPVRNVAHGDGSQTRTEK